MSVWLITFIEDYPRFETFLQKTAQRVIDQYTSSSEEKVTALLHMTEQSLSEIFTGFGVQDDVMSSAKSVIKNYITFLKDQPRSLSVMLKLASHGDHLYYQSIATSIFSLYLAKAQGYNNHKSLELIALGGLLHDIGMSQIPKSIVQKEGSLNKEEWDKVKEHPFLGIEMLKETAGVPEEVQLIIHQHHEQPSGKGYPYQLRGPLIYHFSKMISVADSFSALVSKRPYREAYPPAQALEKLQLESGKYDRKLLEDFVQMFSHQNKKAA